MGIIAWIIIGGLAGALAKWIMKEEGGSLIRNILLGIVGAFVGGFVTDLLGGEGVTGFNLWSLLVATIGAVIVIWLARLISGSKK